MADAAANGPASAAGRFRPGVAAAPFGLVGAYRFDGRKITEARFAWDFDEALKADGISE